MRGSTALVSGTYYAGEIDPNTPVPFSLTLTSARNAPLENGTASLNLSLVYQNDYGTTLTFNNAPTTITLTPQRPTTLRTTHLGRGGPLIDYARIALVAVIAVAVIGSFALSWRSRKMDAALKSPSAEKEQKVILIIATSYLTEGL